MSMTGKENATRLCRRRRSFQIGVLRNYVMLEKKKRAAKRKERRMQPENRSQSCTGAGLAQKRVYLSNIVCEGSRCCL